MVTEKFLYPSQPNRCTITGLSNVGKSVFLTNLILNIVKEYDKKYIYSPSFHQDFYQKLFKWFSNFIPIHVIPKTVKEEDINIVSDEIVNRKDFEKSETEIESYDNIEELKFPQEYDYNQTIAFILDDLSEKEKNNPKVESLFKRWRHN